MAVLRPIHFLHEHKLYNLPHMHTVFPPGLRHKYHVFKVFSIIRQHEIPYSGNNIHTNVIVLANIRSTDTGVFHLQRH